MWLLSKGTKHQILHKGKKTSQNAVTVYIPPHLPPTAVS